MVAQAREKAKQAKEHFVEPIENPCHAMSTGKQIDKRLQKIMNATSHTRSNTAMEIGEAYTIFCNLPTYFFQRSTRIV